MTKRVIFPLLPDVLLLAGMTTQAAEPVSGYDYLIDELKQMQDDEFANPGMAAVDEGRKSFHEPGVNGKSCASCHGQPFDQRDPAKPGLMAAYHRQCMECHDAMNLEKPVATNCVACHPKKS